MLSASWARVRRKELNSSIARSISESGSRGNSGNDEQTESRKTPLPLLKKALAPPSASWVLRSFHDATGNGARLYRPRSAQNDLKDIIEDHLEELFGGYEEKFKALALTQHPLGAK